jgi:lysophospholipase L1-like esterase
MSKIYDGNGNLIEISGSNSSLFDVTDYGSFSDNDGIASRQAILTYDGKRLYPKNYPTQRLDVLKKYNGGIMLTLGDSYTAFMTNYFSTFAEKHGLVQDNRGLASSTIAGSEDKLTVGYHAFWVRLNEAIAEYETEGGHTIGDKSYTLEDVKLITFMGGANDWSTVNSEMDRLGKGPNETNKETLYGACNYIFATLLEKFPNADIVVILQPVNYAQTIPTTEEAAKNVGFESLAQVQEMTDAQYSSYMMMRKEKIVREVAERYGLPMCDCCFDWYNPIRQNEAETYWDKDKLHLNATGHQAIIDKLEYTVNNLSFSRN